MIRRCRYGSQWDNVDTSLLVLFPRSLPYELIWIRCSGNVNTVRNRRELGLFKEEQEEDEGQCKYDAERTVAPSPSLR